MTRPWLIVTVVLASYAVLNVLCSLIAAAAWRWRIAAAVSPRPHLRARRLLMLRAFPAAAAAIATLGLIVPAFSMFEPYRAAEPVGPALVALAAFGFAQCAIAAITAVVTTIRTSLAARRWLRAGSSLTLNPPAGVAAYVIESLAPIVALIGVFQPKLVAARSVIEACTAAELNAIVAHERGHLHAQDNLKRWLMACAPDALRWTRLHREITTAWHDAAEDAADDAATAGDTASRVDLAALIVKIAKLAPAPAWREATVSPFVEPAGLDRRVRRLLAAHGPAGQRQHSYLRLAIAAAAIAAAVSLLTRPAVLERVYFAVEAVVSFGR
jgi:Zn-dependent protease with chaperone function